MKSIRTLFAAAGVAAVLSVSSFAAESEPGFVDIGQLMPASKGQFVEINISPMMLKFAARIVAHDEPEAAELLGNLKRVRVNVVSLDDSNRKGTIEQIDGIRRKLEAAGWSQMVSVREKDGGDNVNVHVKQLGEDTIEGLVVTVIDGKGEAVVVNIVGNIKADQIAKVARDLDIEPLHGMKIKLKKHKGHDRDDKDEDDEA